MANIYAKSMRDALQEAREYRDPTNEAINIHWANFKVAGVNMDHYDIDKVHQAIAKHFKVKNIDDLKVGSPERNKALDMLNKAQMDYSKALDAKKAKLKKESVTEGKGFLEYDEWLKKEKGIAKGAHGINSDEHAKYSAEWRAYIKGLFDKLPPINAGESNLKEIVGGMGHMTITQGKKVMIIKTKDWQTYKAKGWVKKTN